MVEAILQVTTIWSLKIKIINPMLKIAKIRAINLATSINTTILCGLIMTVTPKQVNFRNSSQTDIIKTKRSMDQVTLNRPGVTLKPLPRPWDTQVQLITADQGAKRRCIVLII